MTEGYTERDYSRYWNNYMLPSNRAAVVFESEIFAAEIGEEATKLIQDRKHYQVNPPPWLPRPPEIQVKISIIEETLRRQHRIDLLAFDKAGREAANKPPKPFLG